MSVPDLKNVRVAVVGLGYVGLPLAAAFGERLPTVGYDIQSQRVAQLRRGHDATRELTPEALAAATSLEVTDDPAAIADCNVYIVTVPTPIDAYKIPDLRPLRGASESLGRVVGTGDVVIFESTVYPGATEEECIPIIERGSGLVYKRDFHAGYSPERINPGDKQHRVTDICKVTAGSSPEVGAFVDALYAQVITAGTYRVSSIRVAEAAKVIENTQRDVNIALVNELAMLFERFGLDTEEILKAAGTKWNFLPFRPGLVGGHCIGVDPYYLTYKAQSLGHHPEMILAGRRINDAMGPYAASEVVKLMLKRQLQIVGARILVLGLAFKENCPDLRNTRVVDIVRELGDYSARVDVHDPNVDTDEAYAEYGISMANDLPEGQYDAVIIAVAHEQFRAMGIDGIRALLNTGGVVYDMKYLLPPEAVEGRL